MSYFSSITMTLEIIIFTIANANYCLLWVFKPVFNSEILKNDLIFDQWILNGLNLVNVVVWFRSRSSYLLHLAILLIFCRLICSELSVCLRVVHMLCHKKIFSLNVEETRSTSILQLGLGKFLVNVFIFQSDENEEKGGVV